MLFLQSCFEKIMKYIAFILLIIVVLPSSAISANLNCPCRVVKITDGDTIHVLDQAIVKYKIRLVGIDAPEKKQAFGKRSTQNLTRLIANKSIDVEYDKRDRYGRILGKLIDQGRDVNLQQIKDGYAWHYKYYQKDQSEIDRILYSSAEVDARAKTKGLWSVPAIPPWEYRRKH